jgi:nucleotide-binding universal stress UspA family protein
MKIVIAYDGSNHADTAIDDLQWAGLPRDAQAIVLSAVEWPTMQSLRSWGMLETDFSPEWTERVARAEQLAEAGYSRLHAHFPQWDIQLETSTGNPATAILDKATGWPADLVVVGTHGRSALGRVVLGSVSLKLVKEAPCSVRVARSSKHEGPIRLLIGNDGSAEAEAVVSEVCRRYWPAGTQVRIVSVQDLLVPANSERMAIGQRLYDQINEDEHFRLRHVANDAGEQLRRAGLIASSIVEEGDPRETLVREAREWNAHSVFIGARGVGRVERLLLGSVSSATVAHAACTVEVVRHI